MGDRFSSQPPARTGLSSFSSKLVFRTALGIMTMLALLIGPYAAATHGAAGHGGTSSHTMTARSQPDESSASLPARSMVVGINPGGGSCCGISVDRAISQAAPYRQVRVDSAGEMGPPSDFYRAGLQVDLVVSGNCVGSSPKGYDTKSVSDLRAARWARCAVAVWRHECHASIAACPLMEELNEPGGTWFWGGSADSAAAKNNYALLLKETWTAFHSTFGANCDTQGTCPLLLGSFDGGCDDGSCRWGQGVLANSYGIAPNAYVDGWTDHPYGSDSKGQASCGGEGSGLAAAAADNYDISIENVATTHAYAGSRPIYITEVGWQTRAGGCSGRQQADNLYGLFQWARHVGYVGGVFVFNYSDFRGWAGGLVGNGQAHLERIRRHKPGWTAFQEAAAERPCTVC